MLVSRWRVLLAPVGLVFVAVLLAAQTEAAVTVTIEAPANGVARVVPDSTQFRAKLVRNGVEDHTAQSTFTWIFDDGLPEEMTGNPVYCGFATPGTHLVSVTGQFEGERSICMKEFKCIGGCGTVDDSGVFLMFHAPYDQPTYFAHALPGQPAGVAYQWSLIEGADKVEVIGGTTAADLELRPVHSSSQTGDIGFGLLYSLGGTTAGAMMPTATNHKPAVPYSFRGGGAFTSVSGPPEWSQTRHMNYHCLSQLNEAMAGMPWVEDVQNYADSPYQGAITHNGAGNPGIVPDDGVVPDEVTFPKVTPWSGQPALLWHAWQHIWVGGWHGQDTSTNPMWTNDIVATDVPMLTVTGTDGHQ